MNGHQQETARRERSSGEGPRGQLVATLPVTQRQVDVAGLATAVLVGGEGQPIVFIQCEHPFVWLRVIPDLVKTHRVVVPDLPGLGETQLPSGRYDLDTALGWLAGLIERTCDAPPVLVAKGPAGTIAACFAAQHGDRLAGLVLVDADGLEKFLHGRVLSHPSGQKSHAHAAAASRQAAPGLRAGPHRRAHDTHLGRGRLSRNVVSMERGRVQTRTATAGRQSGRPRGLTRRLVVSDVRIGLDVLV